jgi:hypothetical protein
VERREGLTVDWGWVPIVVAVIAGPMMWMLHRFERKNDRQHAENGHVLSSIKDAITEQSADIREVKHDVRDLKADHRRLADDHRRLSDNFHAHEETL